MCTETEEHKGKSRAQYIVDRGGKPLFPKVKITNYMIGYWLELGRAKATGMGQSAFEPGDLIHWQNGTGIDLNAWEFRTLRKMSESFASFLPEAKQIACKPPYGNPFNDFDRKKIDSKLRSVFDVLAQPKQRRRR